MRVTQSAVTTHLPQAVAGGNSSGALLLPLLVVAQDLMMTRYSIRSRPGRALPSGRFLFPMTDRRGPVPTVWLSGDGRRERWRRTVAE